MQAYSEIRASTASWEGAWLSPEMNQDYIKAEQKAKEKCDALWALIPNKNNDLTDLTKLLLFYSRKYLTLTELSKLVHCPVI